MKKFLLLLLSLLFLTDFVFSDSAEKLRNEIFTSFNQAKKAIYKNIKVRKTFYCGCPFDFKNNVEIEKCGYIPGKDPKRARRVEMEHVVPASKLCGKTIEWTKGSEKCISSKGKHYKGRKCASEHNAFCNLAYNDLYNLRPAIGEVNNERKDFSFREISEEKSRHGTCNFVIKNKIADPPDNIQGDIARIYLYMNQVYPELDILTEEEILFFKKWSNEDPVNLEECSYNQIIFNLQKNANPFVHNDCKVKFP